MTSDFDVAPEPRFLFTAPWEPIVVRRGDALGLRAFVDQLAEAVAPGLSNRVRDGRWITILAWCLARSHQVFHASGGRTVSTSAQQRERYAWLRPLELMWVARTIALTEDWRDRSLAGRQRVRPWYQDDDQRTDRFGMSVDQFRAYRQTDVYGGYRVAFRKWPELTVLGDGWTPGPGTNRLAKWLDKKLGTARPTSAIHVEHNDEDGISTRSAKLGRGNEYQWWLQHWRPFDKAGRMADDNTLPRRRTDHAKLPERHLLTPLVFGSDQSGTRRRKVAIEVEKASAADHLEVCKHLGLVFADVPAINLLARFSLLADAGMAVMDLVAKAMRSDSRIKLSDVAKLDAMSSACEGLWLAAQEWRKNNTKQIRHIETAHRFASAIPSARPTECLRSLLQHHEMYGGGLRWFVLRNGNIEPRTPPRAGSSRYRFRLWSLCRLATQCGVIRSMPRSIRDDDELEEGEPTEATHE